MQIQETKIPERKANLCRRHPFTLGLLFLLTWGDATGLAQRNTGMADPSALITAFDSFVAKGGGGALLTLSVSNLRGLSSEPMNSGGRVRIDLASGAVTSTVRGLPPGGSFELWLADNRPSLGHTTLAETGDALLKVGDYGFSLTTGVHTLTAALGAEAFRTLFPDRAFVVRAGADPKKSFVLTGSSTLFDRLRRRQVRFRDDAGATLGFDPVAAATRPANFARLAAQGRQLFLKEKFNGNGRSCGTCHVESNNFTIDPELISTLPAADPLFVAETNPALAGLERSDLLRRFGLILVNADGFDPMRRFVFRATQNVQALSNSTTPPQPNLGFFSTNGRNPSPSESLGWGNDGAPLRDFALVAIAQHATRTMTRARGIDFRIPTDEELDALAAYQLALGRQEDFNLPALELKSAAATKGKTLFLDSGNLNEPGHKNCNACHFNAGGTAAMSFNPQTPGFPKLDGSPLGFNIAGATNVNEIPLALALGLPRDGGFGQIPTIFGSFGNTDDLPPEAGGHFELEEFNSPPVVESADTGPFFHNHTAKTLEEAVAFYGTPAFRVSVFAQAVPIQISADPGNPEVQAISAFLRILNALENIRSSINVAERGRNMETDDDARELAALALAETIDALEVLSSGAFAKSLEVAILSARAHLVAAKAVLEVGRRLPSRHAIDNVLDQATRSLRMARAALSNPVTLPTSYRN
jgi:cytochrome c peroxidase